MYRDGTTAELQVLRTDLARTEAARAELERQRAAALVELRRLREGVQPDETLERDPAYRRMRVGLSVLGVVGALGLLGSLQTVSTWAVAEPLWNAQGLRNFYWHVVHGRGLVGLAAAAFVVLSALPWAVLPFVARRGLGHDRRWGWIAAVASSAVFVPTPLLPVAVLCLVVLFSKRVRAVYFPPGA